MYIYTKTRKNVYVCEKCLAFVFSYSLFYPEIVNPLQKFRTIIFALFDKTDMS